MRDPLIERLIGAFPDAVEPMETPFDIPQVKVTKPDRLLEICRWLKDDGFNFLADVGGVDYWPRPSRFEVVYHIHDLTSLRRIRLRVIPVDDANPVVPSVGEVWPSAWAAEREVYDLFGVRFSGHPNLKRILMPEDWQGHPLRKDYPLRGPRHLEEKRYPTQQARFHAPKMPVKLERGK